LTGIRVANAPCSFGAFEITVGVLPDVPEPKRILNAIARAHYEGTIWLASSSRTWSRGRPRTSPTRWRRKSGTAPGSRSTPASNWV